MVQSRQVSNRFNKSMKLVSLAEPCRLLLSNLILFCSAAKCLKMSRRKLALGSLLQLLNLCLLSEAQKPGPPARV